MSESKGKLDKEIGIVLNNCVDTQTAARWLFAFNPSATLIENKNIGFQILNLVSRHFEVPFRSVHVVGSAEKESSKIRRKRA